MSGYVIEQEFHGRRVPVAGKMTIMGGEKRYWAAPGSASHAFSSISNALVMTREKALEISTSYNVRKFGNGEPNRVILDPMGRPAVALDKRNRPAVGPSNYFDATVANFELVAHPGPEAEAKWKSIKAMGRLDHVSDYGSQYVIVGGTLYRYADHWGKFATVSWGINPAPKRPPPYRTLEGRLFQPEKGFAIGKVEFANMRFK